MRIVKLAIRRMMQTLPQIVTCRILGINKLPTLFSEVGTQLFYYNHYVRFILHIKKHIFPAFVDIYTPRKNDRTP